MVEAIVVSLFHTPRRRGKPSVGPVPVSFELWAKISYQYEVELSPFYRHSRKRVENNPI